MASYQVLTSIIAAPPAATAPARDYSHAELLELARRVDWRFLLPEPDLGQVAYQGDEAADLLRSLHVFSQSLTCLSSRPAAADRAETAQAFDLLVLKNPGAPQLRQAGSLLKPGGYLYLEAHGQLHYLKAKRIKQLLPAGPRSLSHVRVVQLLQAGGFTVESTHWHWPNFAACTRLIPLDGPEALRLALAQSDGIQAVLRQAVVRGWLSPRRLAGWVPCFSIIARREPA